MTTTTDSLSARAAEAVSAKIKHAEGELAVLPAWTADEVAAPMIEAIRHLEGVAARSRAMVDLVDAGLDRHGAVGRAQADAASLGLDLIVAAAGAYVAEDRREKVEAAMRVVVEAIVEPSALLGYWAFKGEYLPGE